MRTVNRAYESLSRIGRYNPLNRSTVRTVPSREVGVLVEQDAAKKRATLEIIVPVRPRTFGAGARKLARNATSVHLNGAQMREVFDTLSAFYATRD